jgi:hypothetical protein
MAGTVMAAPIAVPWMGRGQSSPEERVGSTVCHGMVGSLRTVQWSTPCGERQNVPQRRRAYCDGYPLEWRWVPMFSTYAGCLPTTGVLTILKPVAVAGARGSWRTERSELMESPQEVSRADPAVPGRHCQCHPRACVGPRLGAAGRGAGGLALFGSAGMTVTY